MLRKSALTGRRSCRANTLLGALSDMLLYAGGQTRSRMWWSCWTISSSALPQPWSPRTRISSGATTLAWLLGTSGGQACMHGRGVGAPRIRRLAHDLYLVGLQNVWFKPEIFP